MFNPSLKNVIFTPWMRDIILSIRRMIQWRPEPFARIDKDGDRYSFSIPSNYSTAILQDSHIHDEFQFRLAMQGLSRLYYLYTSDHFLRKMVASTMALSTLRSFDPKCPHRFQRKERIQLFRLNLISAAHFLMLFSLLSHEFEQHTRTDVQVWQLQTSIRA
ncbi:hypothetical protein Peur_029368 [Populus x canadensis]